MTFTPSCPKCGKEKSIRDTSMHLGQYSGIAVYCQECGCMISWSPKP